MKIYSIYKGVMAEVKHIDYTDQENGPIPGEDLTSFNRDGEKALIASRFHLQEVAPNTLIPDAVLGWRENKDEGIGYIYPIILSMFYPHCAKAAVVYRGEISHRVTWNGKSYPVVLYTGNEAHPELFAPFLFYCMAGKLPTSAGMAMLIGMKMGTISLVIQGREEFKKRVRQPNDYLKLLLEIITCVRFPLLVDYLRYINREIARRHYHVEGAADDFNYAIYYADEAIRSLAAFDAAAEIKRQHQVIDERSPLTVAQEDINSQAEAVIRQIRFRQPLCKVIVATSALIIASLLELLTPADRVRMERAINDRTPYRPKVVRVDIPPSSSLLVPPAGGAIYTPLPLSDETLALL